MGDKLTTTIDLTIVIKGASGKPEKDLIGQTIVTKEEIDKADDLTLGKLLSWIMSEGIPSSNIKDIKKSLDWLDRVEKDIDGKIIVDEGDISQLEEMLAKVNNPAMTTLKILGSVVRQTEIAKGKLLMLKQKTSK